MSNILAIGSSQLVGFKRGVDYLLDGENSCHCIDYAGMWETGFGYLSLSEDGQIIAPDFEPAKNNPSKVNLARDWRIWDRREHLIPSIHNYEFIYVVASPCKYFAPIYYQEPCPILHSASAIKAVILSGFMSHERFDCISPWMFRIAPIITSLMLACPEKIIFIGAPLPIYGQEKQFIEPLRTKITESKSTSDIHMHVINTIKEICDTTFTTSKPSSFRVLLPPQDTCCDLFLSTREQFYKGNDNAWHANTAYWVRIIEELQARGHLAFQSGG